MSFLEPAGGDKEEDIVISEYEISNNDKVKNFVMSEMGSKEGIIGFGIDPITGVQCVVLDEGYGASTQGVIGSIKVRLSRENLRHDFTEVFVWRPYRKDHKAFKYSERDQFDELAGKEVESRTAAFICYQIPSEILLEKFGSQLTIGQRVLGILEGSQK